MRITLRSLLLLILLTSIGALILRDYRRGLPLQYEAYSQTKLDEYLADGRPVLVTVFGNWTLNTQSNDSVVRTSISVKETCRAVNGAFLRADWTNRSPVVSKLIKELGESSVPITVVYCPTCEAPTVMRDLITEDEIVDALLCCTEECGKTKRSIATNKL